MIKALILDWQGLVVRKAGGQGNELGMKTASTSRISSKSWKNSGGAVTCPA